jgi:uncharacterized protein YcaQ
MCRAPDRANGDEVEAAIKRASCIQLESISTVERSHRVAIAARVGDYPAGTDARRARGALAEPAVAEHWRLRGGAARVRPHVDALVASGDLERVAVEDGGAPVVVEAGVELECRPPTTAALLSPFDNLLWGRAFARRVLGFEHVIEVYKPAPQRLYGYYVLPFLWRDRIVGRADLKSERRDGALVVRSFHLEPGVRRSRALDGAFDRALDRLRRTIGLQRVVR